MDGCPIHLISPHHDDIALSLSITAAQLVGRGLEIRIVNCFTRSRFAPGRRLRGEDEVSAERMREDRAFLSELRLEGASVDLGRRDAPLRYPEGIRAIVRNDDLDGRDGEEMIAVAGAIGRVCPRGAVVLPLAVGHHVDHRIAQTAGLLARPEGPLAFYEDLPYAARCEGREIAPAVSALEDRLGARLAPVVVSSRATFERKSRWITLYGSQLSDAARRSVMQHGRTYDCGERLWVTDAFHQLLACWRLPCLRVAPNGQLVTARI